MYPKWAKKYIFWKIRQSWVFQKKLGHFSDADGWHCSAMSRCSSDPWWHVHLWKRWQQSQCKSGLFNVAQKEGLVFNSAKCAIKQESVTFFDGVFSAKGYSPDPGKIQGISNMPAPQTKQELQSFLGAVNYLQTFMLHLSHHTEPLRVLLKKENTFTWDQNVNDSFQRIKGLLENLHYLIHYNTTTEINQWFYSVTHH